MMYIYNIEWSNYFIIYRMLVGTVLSFLAIYAHGLNYSVQQLISCDNFD